jgi:aminopeptidase N
MTELKDERALPIAIEWTRRGKSNAVRGVAASVLGRLAKLSEQAKDRAYDRLIELLDDEWLRVRLNAVAALAEMKDTRALGPLNRLVDRDLDGRVIRSAREAMARIREGADKGDEVKKLREDFDKLIEENRTLKDRLTKLESGTNGRTAARANGARPKTAAPTRAKSAPKRAAAAARSRNGAKASARTGRTASSGRRSR